MTVVIAARLPEDEPFQTDFPVLDAVIRDDLDYWRILSSVWGSDTLVNVEHDVSATDDRIEDLLSFTHELCTVPYKVYPRDMATPVWAVHWQNGRWLTEGERWATFSAIGFVKIEESAQDTRLRRTTWQYMEGAVAQAAVKGKRLWHVHWPAVEHRHDYTKRGRP